MTKFVICFKTVEHIVKVFSLCSSSPISLVSHTKHRHKILTGQPLTRTFNTGVARNVRSFRLISDDISVTMVKINSRILSVSLASHVSTHLLIHLSARLYYHHHSHHPSLFHSRLKTYLFNKSFPP